MQFYLRPQKTYRLPGKRYSLNLQMVDATSGSLSFTNSDEKLPKYGYKLIYEAKYSAVAVPTRWT